MNDSLADFTSFLPLLAYLATFPADGCFQQWQVRRVGGSGNNMLYRATGLGADLAVKFTIRDARRRAWREMLALTALSQAGLSVAPQAFWLDESSYGQPVVVQSWEAGVVTAVPPQTDAEWEELVRCYVTLHTLTPTQTNLSLPPAVVNFYGRDAAWAQVQQQLAHMPPLAQPETLRRLVDRLYQYHQRQQPLPDRSLALCRDDANILNFLRRPQGWVSVDWENAGWGDPTFEMADLMLHPAYVQVTGARWRWVAARYAALTGEETAVDRIYAYYPYMLVWWVGRVARMLYEVPQGLDERLVKRPSNWTAHMQHLYAHYTALAADWLA